MAFLPTEPGWWNYVWGYHFGGQLIDPGDGQHHRQRPGNDRRVHVAEEVRREVRPRQAHPLQVGVQHEFRLAVQRVHQRAGVDGDAGRVVPELHPAPQAADGVRRGAVPVRDPGDGAAGDVRHRRAVDSRRLQAPGGGVEVHPVGPAEGHPDAEPAAGQEHPVAGDSAGVPRGPHEQGTGRVHQTGQVAQGDLHPHQPGGPGNPRRDEQCLRAHLELAGGDREGEGVGGPDGRGPPEEDRGTLPPGGRHGPSTTSTTGSRSNWTTNWPAKRCRKGVSDGQRRRFAGT